MRALKCLPVLLAVVISQQTLSQQAPGHLLQEPASGRGEGGTGQAPGHLLEEPLGGQVPEHLQNPGHLRPELIGEDAIFVTNQANVELTFAYWDGDTWTQVSLPSGRGETITCAKCGQALEISFHDGTQRQLFQAPTESAYIIHWTGQRWAFESLP